MSVKYERGVNPLTYLWRKCGKLLPDFAKDWYYNHIKVPYYKKKNIIIRTINKEEFLRKVSTVNIEEVGEIYWKKQTKWQSQDNISPRRYKKMLEFIRNFLTPHLKDDFVVADLACAAGDLTFLIADKVQQVDAFELSADMVVLAEKQAKERNITNIKFQQADATKVELLKEKYDAFMMLGLLTCLEDESSEDIVKKIYASMKQGAKLLVKEGITRLKSIEYFYNRINGCLCFYRTEDHYIKLFEDNGFKIIGKTKVESKNHLGLLLEKYG